MGVSGSGKTTIGRALATVLHWSFSDADDFHSSQNVEKMKNHFFNSALLRSQFEALEIPKDALVIYVSKETAEIVRRILGLIG
jgi:gluconate kinase